MLKRSISFLLAAVLCLSLGLAGISARAEENKPEPQTNSEKVEKTEEVKASEKAPQPARKDQKAGKGDSENHAEKKDNGQKEAKEKEEKSLLEQLLACETIDGMKKLYAAHKAEVDAMPKAQLNQLIAHHNELAVKEKAEPVALFKLEEAPEKAKDPSKDASGKNDHREEPPADGKQPASQQKDEAEKPAVLTAEELLAIDDYKTLNAALTEAQISSLTPEEKEAVDARLQQLHEALQASQKSMDEILANETYEARKAAYEAADKTVLLPRHQAAIEAQLAEQNPLFPELMALETYAELKAAYTEDAKAQLTEAQNAEVEARLQSLMPVYDKLMAMTEYEALVKAYEEAMKQDPKPLDETQAAAVEARIAELKPLSLLEGDALSARLLTYTTSASLEEAYASLTEAQLKTLTKDQKKAIKARIAELKEAETKANSAEKDQKLYDDLMAAETLDELKSVMGDYGTVEEYNAFLNRLDQDVRTSLYEHIDDVVSYVPHSVSFTKAGPFMPAVDVSHLLAATPSLLNLDEFALYNVDPDDPNGNGLFTQKNAKPNGKGGYTIQLNSWTTGSVKTTEEVTPADICIVVDQSASMKEAMGDTTKAAAMQAALKTFVGNVKTKDGGHQIAIVGYADNQNYGPHTEGPFWKPTYVPGRYLDTGWVNVDEKGAADLNAKIDKMEFIGNNTDIQGGVGVVGGDKTDNAWALMNSRYKVPANSGTKRQKVVVIFTDGYPSTLEGQVPNDFDIGISNGAVNTANKMKQAGITIFTVGMFNGVNPNELYGPNLNSGVADGQPKHYWSNLDKNVSYPPACNRLMNYMSSNTATTNDSEKMNLGLDYQGPGTGREGKDPHKFTIISNLDKTKDGYYLTAVTKDDLEKVFNTIVTHVSTPSVSLGTDAVLTDTVTQYFTVPKDAKAIHVYTDDCVGFDENGKPIWASEQKGESALKPFNAKVTVKDNTVKVTNFDYNKNFVTEDGHSGDKKDLGRRLVVKFDVVPKDGFMGGNGVPTNTPDSGIIRPTEGGGTEVMDNFEVPHVNVPVVDFHVTLPDGYVYLNGTVKRDKLAGQITVYALNGKNGAEGNELDLVKGKAGKYGLPADQQWKADYIEISTAHENSKFQNMTEDLTFHLTIGAKPTVGGTPDKDNYKSFEGHIYVLDPTVTWIDSGVNAGQKPDYKNNLDSVKWMHSGKTDREDPIKGKIVDVRDAAPELTFTYSPAPSKLTEDTFVKVTGTKIGDFDAANWTTHTHNNSCPIKHGSCQWTTDPQAAENHFIVHIKSFDLKIVKSVTGTNAKDSFLFQITGPDNFNQTVVIHGSGEVVLKGLPSGSYKVTELAGWSTGYNAVGETTVTITPASKGGSMKTAAFTNTYHGSTPITGESSVENKWSGSKIVSPSK